MLASAITITVAISVLRTGDGLSLHHLQGHSDCRWYVVVVVIVVFGAHLAFRELLQQRPKMIAVAQCASTKRQFNARYTCGGWMECSPKPHTLVCPRRERSSSRSTMSCVNCTTRVCSA
ncbi:hypothetical protein BGW80DRAFT_1344055 [Lactifluus volemus]|nr:hypothetical protein BGW80DRAFT_1344055 [Lactifluus volemus]